jgi:hypothetical protein
MNGRTMSSGAVAMPFNSPSMYRGAIGADGVPRVAILGEDLTAVP